MHVLRVDARHSTKSPAFFQCARDRTIIVGAGLCGARGNAQVHAARCALESELQRQERRRREGASGRPALAEGEPLRG